MEDDDNKIANIEGLLQRNYNRYKHNTYPYENASYIQLVHNPVNRAQFITVQQCKRMKKTDLGYKMGRGGHGGGGPPGAGEGQDPGGEGKRKGNKGKKGGDGQAADNAAGAAGESARKVLNDRGKGIYRFKYETCKSSGPSLYDGFTDPDGQVTGVGDGHWDTDAVEPPCEHSATPNRKCECQENREYLIVAVWKFNETLDSLEIL